MTRGKTGKIIAKTKKTITGKYAVDGPPMLCGLVAPACSKIRFPIVSRKNPRGLYPRQILSGEFGSCQSAYLGYPIKWQSTADVERLFCLQNPQLVVLSAQISNHLIPCSMFLY